MAPHALQRPSSPFTDELQRLGAARDAACLVDREGTVLFVNLAWERFARENGGGAACAAEAVVGTRLLDHVAGEEEREAAGQLLARALRRAAAGGRPVVQTSECNGPDVARLLVTHAEPVVAPGGVVAVALLHRVVRELPVTEVYAPADGGARSWRDPDGGLVQCGCCRRTRRPEAPEEWDFVPGLVAAPAGAAFTVCPLCRELHYATGPAPDR